MKDKLLPTSKFPLALGISAIFIALCAAFFSVYGIAALFAGASLSVIIMASSLEIGKLVATTFIYRYWSKCKTYLKAYLIAAILILMLITSLGIFGYLSAAYQKSSIEFVVTQEKIKNTEDQKTFYQSKIASAQKRIGDLTSLRISQENRMSGVLTNEYVSRNPLQLKQLQEQTVELITSTDNNIKDENQKIQDSNDQIQKINESVNQLKMASAEKKDVQTFKFVADALGVSLDTVARWFIICIICVFDPLAICLVLAYNVSVYRKEDESVYDTTPNIPTESPKHLLLDSEPQKTVPTDVISPTPITTPPVEIKKETSPKEEKDGFFTQYFKR